MSSARSHTPDVRCSRNRIDRAGKSFPTQLRAGRLTRRTQTVDLQPVTRRQKPSLARNFFLHPHQLRTVYVRHLPAFRAHQMLPDRLLAEQMLVALEALAEI